MFINFIQINVLNVKISPSVSLLRLTQCTDFNEMWHADTLIPEEESVSYLSWVARKNKALELQAKKKTYNAAAKYC